MKQIYFLNVAGWPQPVLPSDRSEGKMNLAQAAEYWQAKPGSLRSLWVKTFSDLLAASHEETRPQFTLSKGCVLQ